MPEHVKQALVLANRGRARSEQTRRKIGVAHKRLGTVPPKAVGKLWTSEEDELIRTLPAKEAIRRLNRTVRAVYMRREALGVGKPHRKPRWQHLLIASGPDRSLGAQLEAESTKNVKKDKS